ncbi:MAG: aminotransferase class V-fold PLP-dependent enzyme, partial [Bacteroidota bacterium]
MKNDIHEKSGRAIPTMLDYKTHIENDSLFNTPPVFPIYVCMATLEWLKEIGGVSAIEKINTQKAELLYNEIDSNPLFKGTADVGSRSKMNVCFLLEKPELDESFSALLKESGIIGLKGHRSVGGYRASLYNALPLSSVEFLVSLMQDFAKKNG